MNELPRNQTRHHRCGPPGFVRRFWQRRKAKRLDKLATKLQLSSTQRVAPDEIIATLEDGRQLMMQQGSRMLEQLSSILHDPEIAAAGEADQVFTPIREQYLQLTANVAAFSRQLSEEQRQAVEALFDRGLHRCGRLTCRA